MEYKNLVNGEWVDSQDKIEIFSPINNESLGTVPAMTREEVDIAMETAKIAQQKWRELSVVERAKYLNKAAEILERDKEIIGEILAKEVSKGIKAAIGEVVRTADLIRYAAAEGSRSVGEIIDGGSFEASSNHKLALVRREPVGLVLAIAPFNYPVNLSGSKIAPALIAGNVVIFKPPTQGAISGLLLVKAFHEAGIPAGVLNTVTGKGSVIGDYLIEHPFVDFVNFTGSTGVGKRIGQLAGMKAIMLELGGKDGAIVAEDADLERAAKEIVSGAFSYSGQRCTAIKRVLVVDSVADKLADLLKKEVEKLTVGDPFDNADVTPLIDTKSADFIEELINDAVNKGAKALTPIKREGNLVYPVLFDNITLDMIMAWEEPFGPVLPIIRVKDLDEALDIANSSQYGLQTSVFTKNITKAMEIANKLEVGTVHINNKTQRGPDNFPFLGVKGSGAGVQGIKYSIESMTRIKSIVIDIK